MNNTECFFFQPTDYTSSATVCKWCGKEKYQHKSEQKQLIIDIMNDDAKDGLYKQQTAVQWFADKIDLLIDYVDEKTANAFLKLIEQAKQMEKQQKKKAFEKGYECGVGDYIDCENGFDCKYIGFEKYYNTEYGGEQ